MRQFYAIGAGTVPGVGEPPGTAPRLNYEERVVQGNSLQGGPSRRRPGARVSLAGDGPVPVELDGRLISQHIGVVGNSGSGKTNAILQIAGGINETMEEQDILIFFDTKGDMYEHFYEPGDLVFGNTPVAGEELACWNMLRETLLDGPEKVEENIYEIARMLFADRIKKSNNPFFPQAGMDLFASVLYLLELERGCTGAEPDNRLFYETCCLTAPELLARMAPFPQLKGMEQYIGRNNDQTSGILGELRSVVRELFIGQFGKKGSCSIRETIREHPECRRIFVEFDLAVGNVLAPVYRTLIDLSIKEGLRRGSRRKVFLVLDEYRLLPRMNHIENAISFGRGRVHITAGLQYIGQLREGYTKDIADGMLANFGTLMVFRTEDPETRKLVRERFGRNRKCGSFSGYERGTQNQIFEANVVEDWDISRLRPGECIVGHPGEEPYRFRFGLI
jgi:type IV secretory pathway TraG/TraD family ATPase VirD4